MLWGQGLRFRVNLRFRVTVRTMSSEVRRRASVSVACWRDARASPRSSPVAMAALLGLGFGLGLRLGLGSGLGEVGVGTR